MSALETAIWYILGYATMPVVFLAGFAATALVTCLFLDLIGRSER